MPALPGLDGGQSLALAVLCLVAGVVRGFSGFALSAVVMASAASFIPPVKLIPLLWFQEMAASLVMARSGLRDADRKTAGLLVAGNWIGWPIGLWLTLSLPETSSKALALAVIVALAALQLARVRLPGLRSAAGPAMAGIVAGIVSGLAHVGGMVVALFVLAQGAAARSMRGTLVLYLFIGSLGAFIYQTGMGVMTWTAAAQGLLLAPVTLLGVLAGIRLFNPRWEPYYKPACLGLLILLALAGLARLTL